ncbi:uncharacterized protein LY89DRAFT_678704 [Mollisia scopiformis]|uniref:Transmembrane protein n=1 Tax=Mollisia scopiformis TaxID=149040 RepID=A0A132B225_MOLSC|nr:uncharacterized protein LY89DRAFT_678704 [Mollisia scopiformis]KUJ06432.1 hypothetical protein LY89DRAFT_678704 [Mollisia scopiformis]
MVDAAVDSFVLVLPLLSPLLALPIIVIVVGLLQFLLYLLPYLIYCRLLLFLLSISSLVVEGDPRGRDRRTWRCSYGRGSSSLVSEVSFVFMQWWVSLLISVCVSWCLCFSRCFPDSGSPPGAGYGGACREPESLNA